MKPTDILGNIKLYNADCMELLKQTPDNYYSLALVDPPYGLGDAVVNSGGRFKRYHNEDGNWDKNIPTLEYFEELFRVSKNQIIWGGNYFNLPATKCFVVWDKMQPQGISFSMCEFAWTSFDQVAKIYRERPQGQKMRFHPTQKPVQLYKWLLKNYAKEGDTILDTHFGSLSIGIACHDLKFDLTAIELDKDYYEAAKNRLSFHQRQLTLF